MFHLVRSGNHGIIFAILCIGKPLISPFIQQDMWSIPHVVEATNADYLRMKSLKSLEGSSFRMDILSGNLVQYIINEFQKARAGLGDISTESPEYQYEEKQSLFTKILTGLVGDFPLIYYAVITLLNPTSISVSTIASLQQSAILLRWLFWDIFYQADLIRRSVSRVQNLYDMEKNIQVMKDGDLPYPSEKQSVKGMGFELRLNISGGERQRLVASRTFMRFHSDQIKFVAVDEPSSALDPEGELELFNNLREARTNKTMIFVTHRFGHLTKYADKILCMKEGKVEEFGTHVELMAKEGEYCKMYNIQAKAFETLES
ncbi:P-loop containing nucleoside triphosphate hydrolase protein [Gymnopus androsaceus JB14]|uniref:P-loop containing nucleoside triphosphate hydrolase protein n=1 Tax=Gymnopus androsaceus JB14 TaxID=1447944 RepID=A0A6A4I2X4_9AGAR|nr:P-loop containing nucleoside triphosphate hydrolase protein [Gymnopus androsaceus JB14]